MRACRRAATARCSRPCRKHDGGAHSGGSVTLNLILASCSGALPILRRNGSQRGSEWILSNRFCGTISPSPAILVRDRLVEPLKRLVGLAAEGVDVGNVVGPVLFVLGDQCGERGIGVAPCARARSRPSAGRSSATPSSVLLLDLGERAGSIALEQQRHPELSVHRPAARAQAQRRAKRCDRFIVPASHALVARRGYEATSMFTGSRRTTASASANASSRRPRLERKKAASLSTPRSVGSSAKARWKCRAAPAEIVVSYIAI